MNPTAALEYFPPCALANYQPTPPGRQRAAFARAARPALSRLFPAPRPRTSATLPRYSSGALGKMTGLETFVKLAKIVWVRSEPCWAHTAPWTRIALLLGSHGFCEYAKAGRGGLRLVGSGEGVRCQAQVCVSERCLLLADPASGAVCPRPYKLRSLYPSGQG